MNGLVTKETQDLIIEKTPAKFIKTRPGPGGKALSYVEVGYVIDRLNKIFNYNWSFQIIEKTIGKKQIEVLGRLTGRFYHEPSSQWVEVVKEQFGGIDIKYQRGSDISVSIADDLKAAGSDSLKKCASMFGIAQDLYWMGGSEFDEDINVDQVAKAIDEDGYTHEPIPDFSEPPMPALICGVCGKPASHRTGNKNGKQWAGIFCSTGDKSHTRFID